MLLLRPRTLPTGFIAPCLPTAAPSAPSGDQWLHEIKHDGIRIIARMQDKRVKLYSRPGNDLTSRFPQIVEALSRLRSRSCIIDGEAVACGDDGIALFERIRYRRHDASVFKNSTATICGVSRSNGARQRWGGCLLAHGRRAAQRASGGRGAGRIRPCVSYGPGGDRVEAQGLVVQLRAFAGLGKGEEPQGAGTDPTGSRGPLDEAGRERTASRRNRKCPQTQIIC